MPTSPRNSVIEHLRRAGLLRDGAGLGDGELLGCFIERHDEAAFAALVKRHGPMVWGVCRRLLNHHAAEDAFQATFLILVRKARAIVPREMVGNWLYGVAHRTALQARRTAARRRAREVQVPVMPDPEAMSPDHWAVVQPLLDQELSRLPENYRAVLVLCDLEGRTRKEVARHLGVLEGTVAGRLARARTLLAKRLTGRGVTLSGGALAAVLAQHVASADVPTSVVSATLRAAGFVAAGQVGAAGAISVEVVALTEGVLKALLLSKLKAVVGVVLVLGCLGTGATVLAYRTAAAQSGKPPVAEERVPTRPRQEREQEGFTAWGKEAGGLQAGLGYLPGQHRTYYTGETAKLVLRVRNVCKKVVQFQYLRQFFMEHPPTVTDGQGKPIHLPSAADESQVHLPVDVKLAPGKEIELAELHFKLRPARESGTKDFSIHYVKGKAIVQYHLYGTGKFTVQYERVFGMTAIGHLTLDPAWSQLATGKLELEIQSAPPAPANQFPVGWGGGGGQDYEIRVDKTVRHGGQASGSIRSIVPTPLWYGALTQAFQAERFRGQRLRMTAYVKSQDVENSAGLWMRIEGSDGKGHYSVASDLMGTPLKGTNNWQLRQVVLDVPQEGTAQIYFGVMLAGKGQVWVDDFKFEAVGQEVKTTGRRAVETGKEAVGPGKHLSTEPKNLDFEQ